jgi:GNAT superfamily N-acetyltransferase
MSQIVCIRQIEDKDSSKEMADLIASAFKSEQELYLGLPNSEDGLDDPNYVLEIVPYLRDYGFVSELISSSPSPSSSSPSSCLIGVLLGATKEAPSSSFPSSLIRSVSILAISTTHQGKGLGRKLIDAFIKAAESESSQLGLETHSIRLTVNSHHLTSYSLYLSCGFNIGETISVVEWSQTRWLQARNQITSSLSTSLKILPSSTSSSSTSSTSSGTLIVRRIVESDLKDCGELMEAVIGFSRVNDLRGKIQFAASEPDSSMFIPFLLEEITVDSESEGVKRVVLALNASLVGEYTIGTNAVAIYHLLAARFDMLRTSLSSPSPSLSPSSTSLSGSGSSITSPETLLPYLLVPAQSHSEVLRWCLSAGMRVIKNMFCMVHGTYNSKRNNNGVYISGVEY